MILNHIFAYIKARCAKYRIYFTKNNKL